MDYTYIISLGTSILTNAYRRNDKWKAIISEGLAQRSLENDSSIFKDLLKPLFQDLKRIAYENTTEEFLKASSAEINTLFSIKPQGDPQKDHIHLISTFTSEGLAAAFLHKKILVELFEYNTKHVTIEPIRYLDIRNTLKFQKKGVPNLIHTIAGIHSNSKLEGRHTVLNVTGGYKPVNTFMVFAGMLLGIDVHYAYIQGELMKLPLLPIAFDMKELKKGNITLLRKLHENGKLNREDYNRLNKRGFDAGNILFDKEKGAEEIHLSDISSMFLASYVGSAVDPLCKRVLNRAAFNAHMMHIFPEKTKRKTKRAATPILLAFFDLDKFKKINDDYDHETGDKALKVFSETLSKFESDYKGAVFARWGGDEFIGVFPGITYEQSEKLLKKILQAIRDIKMPDYNEIKMTSTIGSVYITIHRSDTSWKDYRKAADQLLVASKSHEERNCVKLSRFEDVHR